MNKVEKKPYSSLVIQTRSVKTEAGNDGTNMTTYKEGLNHTTLYVIQVFPCETSEYSKNVIPTN